MKPETKSVSRRPRRQVWHREDIKAELRKRFGTLSGLATSLGFNRSAITHTLLRPQHHKPMALRVAEALDVPAHELWPSVFQPETRSVSCGRNPNRPAGGREQQKMGQEVA